MLFGSANRVLAQTPTFCDEDPCEGTEWLSGGASLGLHPLFPNCKFKVHFLFETCPDGTVTFTVQYYSFENNQGVITPECAALKAYLATHPEDNQLIYENSIDRISRYLFDEKLKATPNNPNLKCPNGKQTYYSYVAKCTKYCFYDDTRSITTGGGTGMSYIVPLNCSVSGCCKVKHVICFDETTQSVIDIKTTTRVGPDLVCTGILGNTCPAVFTIQNTGSGGGTYDIPLSGSSSCQPSSCAQ